MSNKKTLPPPDPPVVLDGVRVRLLERCDEVDKSPAELQAPHTW